MLLALSKIRPAFPRAAPALPCLGPSPPRSLFASSRLLQTPLAAQQLPPAPAHGQAHADDAMATQEGGKEAKKAAGAGVTLKTPKGTRDWAGDDMLLRDDVLYVPRPEAAALAGR